MAWPPAAWERQAHAWRDDVPSCVEWELPTTSVPAPGVPSEAPAEPPKPSGGRSPYPMLAREMLETIILTAIIFVGIRLVVQNFRIEGRSMEPNLHSGEYLLVNKMAYRGVGEPERGDIVVFQAWNQEKDFIKRVVGVPGDELQIRDGCVHINDTCLEEPYLDQATTDAIGPVRLEEGEYYVLGDNRGNSSDSRAYGPLDQDRIVGRAWFTYWPPGDIGLVPASDQSFASQD